MLTCVCVCVPVGDQVARKGTLTGGYYDPNRSRLRVQHEIYKLRKSLESTEAEKAQIQEEVEHILHKCSCYFQSPCVTVATLLSRIHIVDTYWEPYMYSYTVD